MQCCSTLRIALIWVACAAPLAHAQDHAKTQCRLAVPEGHPMVHRAETIASMQHLPDSCLKSMLVECDETARASLVDPGSAALCSMGYEALLRKSFGGSFGAMLAWWQQGGAPPPTP
jgi:hypothetical protein